MKKGKIRTNFAWALAGQGTFAVAYMGVLVGLAHLGSAEVLGQFALGMAFTSPMIMLANLQLRMVQATDAGGQYSFGDYLGLRMITTTCVVFLAALLPLLLGYQAYLAGVIAAVGLAKGADSAADILYGAFQRGERMDFVSKSMLIRAPLLLLGVLGGVWLLGDATSGVLLWAFASCAVLLLFDLPNFRKNIQKDVRARFAKKSLLGIFQLGFPLGMALLGTTLILNIPRYMIEHYHGVAALGIFAALSYFIQAEHLVIVALSHAVVPRLARYHQTGEGQKFRRILLTKLNLVLLLGCLGWATALFFGREIISLFYPGRFAEYSPLFALLMLTAIPWQLSLSLGHVLTAQRKMRIQFYISALVVGFIIFLGSCWIPDHGLNGAVWSMLVASSAHLLLNAIAVCFCKSQSIENQEEKLEILSE